MVPPSGDPPSRHEKSPRDTESLHARDGDDLRYPESGHAAPPSTNAAHERRACELCHLAPGHGANLRLRSTWDPLGVGLARKYAMTRTRPAPQFTRGKQNVRERHRVPATAHFGPYAAQEWQMRHLRW